MSLRVFHLKLSSRPSHLTDCDFNWIDLPVRDERGYPIQKRGVSDFAGLYFCGLHWMHTLKSGVLFGVSDDAAHIVDHLIENMA